MCSLRRLCGEILLVCHMLHPGHRRAVQGFLDSDVRHGTRLGGAVPMLMVGWAPYDVTSANIDALFSFALRPAGPCCDDQGLPERMRVPRGPRARLEGH